MQSCDPPPQSLQAHNVLRIPDLEQYKNLNFPTVVAGLAGSAVVVAFLTLKVNMMGALALVGARVLRVARPSAMGAAMGGALASAMGGALGMIRGNATLPGMGALALVGAPVLRVTRASAMGGALGMGGDNAVMPRFGRFWANLT